MVQAPTLACRGEASQGSNPSKKTNLILGRPGRAGYVRHPSFEYLCYFSWCSHLLILFWHDKKLRLFRQLYNQNQKSHLGHKFTLHKSHFTIMIGQVAFKCRALFQIKVNAFLNFSQIKILWGENFKLVHILSTMQDP